MSASPVRSALGEASEAAREWMDRRMDCREPCARGPCVCADSIATAAIIAFHRRSADDCAARGLVRIADAHRTIAAAVESAAQEPAP